jgi:hypothetical protein
MSSLERPNTYRVTILLCDHVEVAESKLYILGGGWSVSGPGPIRMSLAIKIEVPWHETNKQIHFTLTLVTEDGHQAMVPSPDGQKTPVVLNGAFEAESVNLIEAGSIGIY